MRILIIIYKFPSHTFFYYFIGGMYQRFSTRFIKFKHLNGLTQSFEAINHAMVDFWFVLHYNLHLCHLCLQKSETRCLCLTQK